MYSKCWEIIKDDSKRTFEICGAESNNNHFTNTIHAMQRAGMSVSCFTPPVTNKTASKDIIKITGYIKEEGLYQRLLKEYQEINRQSIDQW